MGHNDIHYYVHSRVESWSLEQLDQTMTKCEHGDQFLKSREVTQKGRLYTLIYCTECHKFRCRDSRRKIKTMRQAWQSLASKPWLIEDNQ